MSKETKPLAREMASELYHKACGVFAAVKDKPVPEQVEALRSQLNLEQLLADKEKLLDACQEIETHLGSFYNALQIAARVEREDDNVSYWNHELKALDNCAVKIRNAMKEGK